MGVERAIRIQRHIRYKKMKEVKIIKNNVGTFWAKKDEDSYSRNIKDLLDYLGVDYIDDTH